MYVLRVSREEQMIEQFEEAYRAYMNRTGCVGPRAAAGRGLFDEILPFPCACTMPHLGPQRPPLRPPKKRLTDQPCFAGCASQAALRRLRFAGCASLLL